MHTFIYVISNPKKDSSSCSRVGAVAARRQNGKETKGSSGEAVLEFRRISSEVVTEIGRSALRDAVEHWQSRVGVAVDKP